VRALRGVSLSVETGEVVTLIGANGAGKTTTLKTIAGLVRPAAGTIEFLGQSLTGAPPRAAVAAGIALVPEGRGVFPAMSVLDNLRAGAYLVRERRAVQEGLEQSFARFPILAERRRQLAGSLSGGQQQMLAVARGLMSRPRLLMLDEPSMGLAPRVVQEISALIQEVNREGVSVLLVEQNARLALGVARRAYVLETGRIVLAGASAALRETDHVRRAYLGT
jgi:branched-chain amino acid transport system ATP-binding protein